VTKGDMLRCLAERTDEQSPVLVDIVC
jgi:hypothetical protein